MACQRVHAYMAYWSSALSTRRARPGGRPQRIARPGRASGAGGAALDQHAARGADRAITGAIDAHVQAERRGGEDDGSAGVLAPVS
jgi:hypothetical protein